LAHIRVLLVMSAKTPCLGFTLILLAAAHPAAALSITITASKPSPAPLGSIIHWTATTSLASGGIWYRFRVHEMGEGFHTIKDYGPDNTLDWGASQHEGSYEIEVTARSLEGDESAVDTAWFQWLPLITGDRPVVSPTAHPLVYLY